MHIAVVIIGLSAGSSLHPGTLFSVGIRVLLHIITLAFPTVLLPQRTGQIEQPYDTSKPYGMSACAKLR